MKARQTKAFAAKDANDAKKSLGVEFSCFAPFASFAVEILSCFLPVAET